MFWRDAFLKLERKRKITTTTTSLLLLSCSSRHNNVLTHAPTNRYLTTDCHRLNRQLIFLRSGANSVQHTPCKCSACHCVCECAIVVQVFGIPRVVACVFAHSSHRKTTTTRTRKVLDAHRWSTHIPTTTLRAERRVRVVTQSRQALVRFCPAIQLSTAVAIGRDLENLVVCYNTLS